MQKKQRREKTWRSGKTSLGGGGKGRYDNESKKETEKRKKGRDQKTGA